MDNNFTLKNNNGELVTKKIAFAEILAKVNKDDFNFDVKSFLTHEIEMLNKKKTTESKKDKERKEQNRRLQEIILNFLIENSEKKFTLKDLSANIEELEELSTSKITSLITPLVKNEQVNKEYEKRTPYYFI